MGKLFPVCFVKSVNHIDKHFVVKGLSMLHFKNATVVIRPQRRCNASTPLDQTIGWEAEELSVVESKQEIVVVIGSTSK